MSGAYGAMGAYASLSGRSYRGSFIVGMMYGARVTGGLIAPETMPKMVPPVPLICPSGGGAMTGFGGMGVDVMSGTYLGAAVTSGGIYTAPPFFTGSEKLKATWVASSKAHPTFLISL